MALFRRKPPSAPATETDAEAEARADGAASPLVSAQELSEDQQAWLQAGLDALAAEGVDYRAPDELAAYNDAQFAAWTLAGANASDPQAIIHNVGCGLGQNLADRTGLTWQLVADVYGTDVALYGTPGDIVVDPFGVVRKRWERAEVDFVPQLLDAMTQDVDALRTDADEPDAAADVGTD